MSIYYNNKCYEIKVQDTYKNKWVTENHRKMILKVELEGWMSQVKNNSGKENTMEEIPVQDNTLVYSQN